MSETKHMYPVTADLW